MGRKAKRNLSYKGAVVCESWAERRRETCLTKGRWSVNHGQKGEEKPVLQRGGGIRNHGQKGEEKPVLQRGGGIRNHGQKGEEKAGPTKGWWLVYIRLIFLFREPGHFHLHHRHAVQTKIYH